MTKSKSAAPAAKPRGRPRRTGADAPAPRDQILDSALQVFAERGYDAASTRDIAARAHVTHTMITYYYATKEDLWKAAVDFLFARLERELMVEPMPESITDEELLGFAREGLRRFIHYCARHPEHLRIMIQQSITESPRLRWAAERHITGNHMSGSAAIRLLQERGIHPQVDTLALMYMTIGASQLIYALAPEVRCIWGVDPEEPDRIARHVEAMIKVFLPDLPPKPSA